MNKVLLSLLFGAFVLSGISFAQTPPPSQAAPTASAAAAPETPKPVVHHERKVERHPEIHKAMRKLRGAKEDLQKAAHDYAGHRVAAIGYIDQALAELRAALQSDKK